MSTHKHIDRICCAALVVTILLTVVFMNGKSLGVQTVLRTAEYESCLFDTSFVHTIDIVMNDWDSFISSAEEEQYAICAVVIDNEVYKNAAIRAKGNTSLTQVANYGNDRYSFKIEFDHYDSTKTYHGLDKLCLNNIIQDNTYMKDYLVYQMMLNFGVAAPLCSFAYITVNGEDHGLYLAVEGVEDAFLERNYGQDAGELYKPDSQNITGGGEHNANDRESPDGEIPGEFGTGGDTNRQTRPEPGTDGPTGMPPGMNMHDTTGDGRDSDGQTPPEIGEKSIDDIPFGINMPEDVQNGKNMLSGSEDVLLKYSDDDYSNYKNIFDNAKTNITDVDRDRLISSLKTLNSGENIETAVDTDAVLRYFAVHNFVCNFDSYTGSMIHNYYLYEKSGQLSMIPWDYNLAFGGFQDIQDASVLVNYPIDTPVSTGEIDGRPMLAWIFADSQYLEKYHQYLDELISSYFDSGYFSDMIDSVTEMIAAYVEKDPTKFCTYEEFEKGAATLKQFCLLRAESIKGQLNNIIPSTSDGQQNSDALISAEEIDISAMGSMGMGDRGEKDMQGGNAGVRLKDIPFGFGGDPPEWNNN